MTIVSFIFVILFVELVSRRCILKMASYVVNLRSTTSSKPLMVVVGTATKTISSSKTITIILPVSSVRPRPRPKIALPVLLTKCLRSTVKNESKKNTPVLTLFKFELTDVRLLLLTLLLVDRINQNTRVHMIPSWIV